jgi:hypothetical protein
MVDVLVRSPDQQKIAGFSIPATEPLPYSHPRLIRNEHVRTNYSLRFLLVASSRYAKLTPPILSRACDARLIATARWMAMLSAPVPCVSRLNGRPCSPTTPAEPRGRPRPFLPLRPETPNKSRSPHRPAKPSDPAPAGPQARHAARLLSPPKGRSGNQSGNCPARPRAAVRSPARRLAGRAA